MGIKKGSKVSMNYTIKVDGVTIDTSTERGPLAFVQGSGQIIPGLENKLLGLDVGDKKTVTLTPEEGYGHRNPDAIQKVPLTVFEDAKSVQVGNIVRGAISGEEFQAIVLDIDENEITLDMNHPLAGKQLDFDVEIVEVE